MNRLALSVEDRLKDLEDAMLLVLISTRAYEPQIVDVVHHGEGNWLVRQASLEQVTAMRDAKRLIIAVAEKKVTDLKDEEVLLSHRINEIGFDLI